MITVSLYSATKIYSAKIKGLKLKRRYEEAEYAFVAPDVELTMLEAQEIFDDVFAGEEIFIVIERDNNKRFRGILQSDGKTYDPETEEYGITAIHQIKKIFNQASGKSATSWLKLSNYKYFERPIAQWPNELFYLATVGSFEFLNYHVV